MKTIRAIGPWMIVLLLASASCTPNPDSQRLSEKTRRVGEARARKGIERYLANQRVDEAQKAIQARDATGLGRAVVELNRLGDEAVELLLTRAADASLAKPDRIAALTILAEMELLTPGVDTRLESIGREDRDADIQVAAAKVLANVRGDK